MLNSPQNVRCPFIFTILFVHKNTPTISKKYVFLYFSKFSPVYSTLTCSQNHPYNPPSITQQFFTSQQAASIFSLPQPFSQFRLRQGTKELGSLVRRDTSLISPFFLKVWTVITGLTITDSLSYRLRKLVYCR